MIWVWIVDNIQNISDFQSKSSSIIINTTYAFNFLSFKKKYDSNQYVYILFSGVSQDTKLDVYINGVNAQNSKFIKAKEIIQRRNLATVYDKLTQYVFNPRDLADTDNVLFVFSTKTDITFPVQITQSYNLYNLNNYVESSLSFSLDKNQFE